MLENYMYKGSQLMDKKVFKSKKKGIVNEITKYIIFIWLLLMCLLPMKLNNLKMVLLVILCFGSFLNMLINRKNVNGKFLIYTLLFVFIYFIFLQYGIKNGYEFDFKLIEIFCLRPIVLFFLVNLIDKKNEFIFFMKSIIVITFIVIIYNLICILGNLHIIPQIMFWENGATIVSDDFLAIRVSNQGTLMYLIPMSIMLIKDIKNINFSVLLRSVIRANIILGVLVVLLSGRRTLQMCTLIAFVFLFIFSFKLNKGSIKKIFICLILIFLLATVGVVFIQKTSEILGINNLLSSVYATIFDAISSGKHTGNIRSIQFNALVCEWIKKPMFGWGLNAYVPYLIRSWDTKWSYEYVYIAFLFQTGVVGILVLCIYTLNIIKKIYTKHLYYKNDDVGIFFTANYVGFLCFLIAGYTNPLVASLWAWLIALVSANIKINK